MTNYDKLVAALRYHADTTNCDACKLYAAGKCELKSCVLHDAADAIEELKDKPWVESVQIDKLRQRIDELEEKQTYCDAYGDKWMTSGKDVPTEAYKHGYADGWEESQKQIDSIENDKTNLEADIINLEIALDKVNTQLPKRGEWELIDGAEPMRWGCSRCKYMSWETSNYCPNCGAKMEVQE